MEPAPPLTYEETSRVLVRLADLRHEIVLVGGQALNFWANYYAARVPELAAGGPYTSADIDFVGGKEAVLECAERLGGTARVATIDDANTPNTGAVLFVDDDRHERQIDFLGDVAGVRRTRETSIGASVINEAGATVATFRVMHPVLCLGSRAHNVIYLDGYQTPHALNQLRAAIVCAKEFIRDVLADDPGAALGFNHYVLDLATYRAGPIVHARYAIDVLGALVTDPGLPAKFYTHEVPHAFARIKRRREKRRAAEERTLAMARRHSP